MTNILAPRNPLTGKTDDLMEGLYLRTEAHGRVTGRAKMDLDNDFYSR